MITDGRIIARHVDNEIDTSTQAGEAGFHLTVSQVGRVTEGGALDFGGSEAEEAEFEWLEPEKRAEDDSYGWWELDGGTYLVEFNERLAEHEFAVVHPLERLVHAGGSHPTFRVEDPDAPLRTMLRVGATGLSIKENARLSRLTLRVAQQ